MTATLLTPWRLCQEGFVSRDRVPCGLRPAEPPGPPHPGALPPVTLPDHLDRRTAKSVSVPVLHEQSRLAHHLRHTRVAKGSDGAAARHRLDAGQSKAYVTAGDDQDSDD